MNRIRFLPATLTILCALLLNACSTAEATDQTCQRLAAVQDNIAHFETAPVRSPSDRVVTVQSFARELDRIGSAASDKQLTSAADSLAHMYWTIADAAAAHPELESMELLRLVGERLDVERINTANATYLRVCPDASGSKSTTRL